MLIIRLLRFLCGYICISVSGDYPERFLNLCAVSGFRVWNTHRRGADMEFCVFARDYKHLRHLRRRCSVKLRVKRRFGLPFILMKYHRAGLVAGAAVFAAVLFIMPKYVWSINISGNQTLETQQIISALDTVGITIGTRLDKVDADNMRLRLALMLPEISWASINIDGTSVNVDIREATARIEKDDAYSNIVADSDGRITAMYVRSGTAAVKVGDAVVKGDLLVSGIEEYKNGQTFFRHSDADVIAEVERTVTVSIPLTKTVTTDTGKSEKRCVLSLLGLDIPLYIGGVNYQYRAEYEEIPLVIDGVTLPVSIKRAVFYETQSAEVTMTAEQAEREAEKLLESGRYGLLGDFEIITRDLTTQQTNNELTLTAKYLLSGNIASTEYISVTDE